MLPDWPSTKKLLSERLDVRLRKEIAARAPVAAQTARVILHEGHQMDHIYPGQKRDTVVLARHEARWKADTQRFIDEPQKVIQEATESLASEMAEQMERELFAKLRTADSGAGGFFTGSSDDELVRNALDTLRKMDISFDEDGKPSIFVAISPEATELLAALQDPSVREEVDSILKEKYREWLYREAHRRLVD